MCSRIFLKGGIHCWRIMSLLCIRWDSWLTAYFQSYIKDHHFLQLFMTLKMSKYIQLTASKSHTHYTGHNDLLHNLKIPSPFKSQPPSVKRTSWASGCDGKKVVSVHPIPLSILWILANVLDSVLISRKEATKNYNYKNQLDNHGV